MEDIVFPRFLDFIYYRNVFLFIGPLMLSIQFATWFFTNIQNKKNNRPKFQFFQGGNFITLIFGLIFSIISVFAFISYENTKFNVLEITEIKAQMIKSKDELNNTKTVILTDTKIIQDGFLELKKAVFYFPNRELFYDGYKIQIRLVNEEQFGNHYISAYRRSSASNKEAYIIVFHNDYKGDRVVNVYSCPEFHEWIHKYIDPLF